jgi:hypothetical protein
MMLGSSAPGNGILIILGSRSGVQVVRVAAPSVIAAMADHAVAGDRTVRQFPRHAVGRALMSRCPGEHSIAIVPDRTGPFPTHRIIATGNVIPEPMLNRNAVTGIPTGHGAEAERVVGMRVLATKKTDATEVTGKLERHRALQSLAACSQSPHSWLGASL